MEGRWGENPPKTQGQKPPPLLQTSASHAVTSYKSRIKGWRGTAKRSLAWGIPRVAGWKGPYWLFTHGRSDASQAGVGDGPALPSLMQRTTEREGKVGQAPKGLGLQRAWGSRRHPTHHRAPARLHRFGHGQRSHRCGREIELGGNTGRGGTLICASPLPRPF